MKLTGTFFAALATTLLAGRSSAFLVAPTWDVPDDLRSAYETLAMVDDEKEVYSVNGTDFKFNFIARRPQMNTKYGHGASGRKHRHRLDIAVKSGDGEEEQEDEIVMGGSES